MDWTDEEQRDLCVQGEVHGWVMGVLERDPSWPCCLVSLVALAGRVLFRTSSGGVAPDCGVFRTSRHRTLGSSASYRLQSPRARCVVILSVHDALLPLRIVCCVLTRSDWISRAPVRSYSITLTGWVGGRGGGAPLSCLPGLLSFTIARFAPNGVCAAVSGVCGVIRE